MQQQSRIVHAFTSSFSMALKGMPAEMNALQILLSTSSREKELQMLSIFCCFLTVRSADASCARSCKRFFETSLESLSCRMELTWFSTPSGAFSQVPIDGSVGSKCAT